MRLLVLLVFTNIFWVSYSQVVNPKIWYIGYQSIGLKDTNSPDINLEHGSTILNFKQNPIGISRFGYALSHGACNVQMYDKNDSLVLYSNGSKIFNGKHRLVEGGDSLSFGRDWTNGLFAGNYYGEYLIRVYPNPMTALPSVKYPHQYYFISIFISRDFDYSPKLVYTLVDMSLNGGKGKVIEKEFVIKTGVLGDAIEACKHGNGRDWWIITREYGKKNFIVMLLDSNGIKIHSEPQVSGWDLADWSALKGNFTNRFSWDGTMFASFTHLGAELFDFNRCTGTLSNRREILLPPNDSFYGGGGGFSPNSKLIYTGNRQYYYQVDIYNGLKMRKIATNDGYTDTPIGQTAGIPTDFGLPQLAPDGKLYMSTVSTTRYLHVIERPNDTGFLCNFKQHSMKLLTFNDGLPRFPNYELGAVANKCGESGIEVFEKDRIEVYPNPASEMCFIRGSNFVIPFQFTIYDLLGKEILTGKTLTVIDVSSLPNGHYFIKISDEKLNQNVRKIEIRK